MYNVYKYLPNKLLTRMPKTVVVTTEAISRPYKNPKGRPQSCLYLIVKFALNASSLSKSVVEFVSTI